MKTGILLINLGTPDAPNTKAVRRYLREFLSDPRVIDVPTPVRWLILNLFILPWRPRQSAKAYSQVWTAHGSPLLIHSINLRNKVRALLGNHYQVELGMRYGNPSIVSAIAKLRHCEKITVLPLFPQYSSAATGSAIAKTFETLQQLWNIPTINICKDFHNHPAFIKAYTEVIQPTIHQQQPDLLLFSYHGLPERHIEKSHCQKTFCNRQQACPALELKNQFCYRAQCYATTKAIAQQLALNPNQYKVSFQSRLGRTPWIQPYTDLLLPELIKDGIKKIAVVCPAFVADCLETLEEIGIRAKEQWLALGGESLQLIPCLNDHDLWVKAVSEIVQP